MEGSVMAMNQKQRDHFVDRVKDLTRDKINALKAMHAGQIQSIADEKYDDFVLALGLQEDMDQLEKAETIWDEECLRIQGILNGLTDIHPSGKDRVYTHRSDAHQLYKEYLNECCRAVAEKEFYNTEAGQELKGLEETQRKAVDTIMMDGSKVADLTLKLNGILGNSGLQLLVGEGVQA